MARTRLYLDQRAAKRGKPAPLKIAINNKSQTALISMNVLLLPSQWDKRTNKVINHPNQLFLNNFITRRKLDIDTMLLNLAESGELGSMSALEIKNNILHQLCPEKESEKVKNDKLFAPRYYKFAERKSEGTREVYLSVYKRLAKFCDNFESLTFEDITNDWLLRYDGFLSKTCPSRNARNVHFRCIRAVFNDAIDDGVTKAYPFRKFKMKSTPTAKRSLSIEQLRDIFNAPTDSRTEKALDIFKLMFFLIGINTKDLCYLKEINNKGRVEFNRAKTSRLYSIKVEPEAMEIIKRYPGKEYLLDLMDNAGSPHSFTVMINHRLKKIGEIVGDESCKSVFPKLSTYWARHSWATIAAELEIPKETIAAALGHGGNTVTDVYINFNDKKVDAANRKVIDWVLYGKK